MKTIFEKTYTENNIDEIDVDLKLLDPSHTKYFDKNKKFIGAIHISIEVPDETDVA